MGLPVMGARSETRIVTEFDQRREIEILIDRLSAEFPGVPEGSVHQVASAAWAEVAHNPVRDAVPDLAEHAAKDSLMRYPVPPSSPSVSGDDAG